MKKLVLSLIGMTLLGSTASAQPPQGERRPAGPGAPGQREGREREDGERRGPRGEGGLGAPGSNIEGAVTRLMTVVRNQDGRITENEYQDSRLRPLLERADANKDKVVTKGELITQLTKQAAARGTAPRGPGAPGGSGRKFGEMGRGRVPMMRPGLVMPEFMMNELRLSDEQRAAVAKLRETVDAELKKILTAEQQQRMAQPAPGFGDPGFGGPGFGGPGFGGPGGPGGPRMRGHGGRPAGEHGERREGERGERPERPERPA